MHDTILGVFATLALLTVPPLVLARPLARLERALAAAAYGVPATALSRNTDGVLVVTTATGKAQR